MKSNLEEVKYMKKQLSITVISLMIFIIGLTGCVEPQKTDYFNNEYEANENTVLNLGLLF